MRLQDRPQWRRFEDAELSVNMMVPTEIINPTISTLMISKHIADCPSLACSVTGEYTGLRKSSSCET
jgi:hypothetical protein